MEQKPMGFITKYEPYVPPNYGKEFLFKLFGLTIAFGTLYGMLTLAGFIKKIIWGEQALRKKHTPGDMTYQELLSSVVAHKLITHQP